MTMRAIGFSLKSSELEQRILEPQINTDTMKRFLWIHPCFITMLTYRAPHDPLPADDILVAYGDAIIDLNP